MINRIRSFSLPLLAVAFVCAGAILAGAYAQTAPLRTISDIIAVMDQEKQDPKRQAEIEAIINAVPPGSESAGTEPRGERRAAAKSGGKGEKGKGGNAGRAPDTTAKSNPQELYDFYVKRAAAYSSVGRFADAVKQLEEAIEVGRAGNINFAAAVSQLGVQARFAGQIAKAIEVEEARQKDPKINLTALLNSHRQLVVNLLQAGEIERADDVLKKMVKDSARAGNDKNAQNNLTGINANLAFAFARVSEARGKFKDAELAYIRAAELYDEAARKQAQSSSNRSQNDGNITARDSSRFSAGMSKARQGRFKEAEIDVRQALIDELQYFGKYGGATRGGTEALGQVLVLQGRYADAERLFRRSAGILDELGFDAHNLTLVATKRKVASVLALMERWDEAGKEYDAIAAAIIGSPTWPAAKAENFLNTPERVQVLYRTGRVDEGIAVAAQVLNSTQKRSGDQHFDTALARGQVAVGHALAKRIDQAMPLFQSAVPVLVAPRQGQDQTDDGTGDDALESVQVRQIVETYIATLADLKTPPAGIDPGIESLKLVDFIRGQSVQRALAASSARAATRDPQLAALVREDQDDERQIAALFQAINDALALPQDQRDNNAIKQMQGIVARLKAKHDAAWKTIASKFPDYANLINPRAPSVDEIRKALRPDEAFVSFYLARQNSFVWVVPKSGPVGFASAPLGATAIEQKVNKLRESLEPKADTLDGVPAFDLAVAYDLYAQLLKPLEASWKPAKSLVVVTNGALGLLPLGVLPTESVTVKANASQPLFSEYRTVPWLARSHAVTTVPSASAFTTLRNLKPSTKKREIMIGFGDPLFSKEQAAEAAREKGIQVAQAFSTTRGAPLNRRNAPKTAGVNGAELALLPRLPDTSDELKAIALALQADPTKVLHLGKEANTRKVKTIDLSGYKIVAFATHGLVPGELEGLAQPALALSAPDVADVDGDGLLTMEEILGLKLDADWVVLSACNTGAGSGAGAEAASGLGRAFFYAGSRALLVTNWSVHSVSARELVTDLFRRQAEDAKLSRSEALRAASMTLLDGAGFQDNGKTVFTYAHPIFWAPYSIIGDGGGA